ncbi:MAG: glycosyltransferase family 4 protein [Candidatus Magasanikbacteria bacterium]
MKVLSLSLDSKIIDQEQSVLDRMSRYSEIVDQYILVVADERKDEVEINDKVKAFGSGGSNKITKFFHIFFLASKILRENIFDIVTTQNPFFLGLVGSMLKNRHNVKLELQFHGWKNSPEWLMKYNLKEADSIRVVSERIKNRLIDEYEVDPEIITVVPIIVKEEIDETKENYEASKPFTFLSVQRLVGVKKVELQIEAIEKLKKQGIDAKLFIAGSGEEEQKLKNLVKEKELQDKVEFLGWLSKEELNQTYTKADCYLLTSNSEGWGRTVVEAAGRGLPIIMTDVGCAGEFIEDEQSGLVIETKNLEELQAAMEKIVEDKSLREKLGKDAIQSYKNLPDEKEIMDKYLQSWQKAIN